VNSKEDTMIAWRNTWTVKPGKMAEAIAALKETIEATAPVLQAGGVARVYTHLEDSNELIFEEMWEDEAKQAGFWEAYNASPVGQAFWAKWGDLAVPDSHATVMWRVMEWR
jgi:quinol monooxygenase YgiN